MQRITIFLTGLLTLGGCSKTNQYEPPPPPSVTVAKPLIQTVTVYLEETGTTEAVERVEIRARVRGFLEEVSFKDGQDVNADEKLYLIEQTEYQANVAAAKAKVAAAKAEFKRADVELKRQLILQKERTAAQRDVDRATAQRDAANAAIDAANADLDKAELDLQYTQVTTPISGRVERTLVKLGNLVGDGEATHLTTVISYDPIHVYFNINERELLRARDRSPEESQGQKADHPKRKDITKIKAYVRRSTDDGFPFQGHLDYADLGVDQSTGTFTIRAIIPNPDFDIWPGLFVHVRIPLDEIENAVLIPERSVAADQAGRYVLIVGDDNLVERRNVEIGPKYADMVVVEKGLSGNETVVIDGIQRARPGGKVAPNLAQLSKVEGSLETVKEGGRPPSEEDGKSAPTSGDAPAKDADSETEASPPETEAEKTQAGASEKRE